MASIETQVVKMLAEQITSAIKSYVDDNNKTYVNTQILNAPTSGNGSGSVAGTITGSINSSQVAGLSNAIGSYIAGIQDSANKGDATANQILVTLQGIADMRIQNATIDTAQIRELHASYGEFIHAVAENLEADNAIIQQASIDLANITTANIGDATINYANIKDIATDTAIFTEGLAGQLFIDRLAVVDANMVSLSVGELMIKNKDGDLVRLFADDKGNVTTEKVAFSGDDIIVNNSLSGDRVSENSLSGTKIIENSITARELNVGSIFADEAMIRAIKASNIDVASLFASNAYISALETNIITNHKIGDEIDLSNNPTITMLDGLIKLMVGDSTGTDGKLNLTDNMLTAISQGIKVDEFVNKLPKDIIRSTTAPLNPVVGNLWLDTSEVPYVFKTWNGSYWEVVNWYDSSELEEKLNNVSSYLELTKDKIESSVLSKDINIAIDGAIEGVTESISKIEQKADSISLEVNKKTTTYRQDYRPENPSDNELWVNTTNNNIYQYHIDKSVVMPNIYYNDEGYLLIDYDSGHHNIENMYIDEEGNVQYLADNTHEISESGRLLYSGDWVEVKRDDYAQLQIDFEGIRGIVTSINGSYSVVQQKANRIDLLVDNVYNEGQAGSTFTLTDKFIELMSDNVVINSSNQITLNALNGINFGDSATFKTSVSSMANKTYCTEILMPISTLDGEAEEEGKLCIVLSGGLYNRYIYQNLSWKLNNIEDDYQAILEGEEIRIYKYNNGAWHIVVPNNGDLLKNSAENTETYMYNGRVWNRIESSVFESLSYNQNQLIEQMAGVQSKTQYLEYDDTRGLSIYNKTGGAKTSELLLTASGVQVVTDRSEDKSFSEFTSNYVRFGNYKLMRTDGGGLAFVYKKD